MMIPPIAAPSAPARDAGKAPADRFEQAIAAALGIVAVQAQPVIESGDTGTAPGAMASGVHAVLAAGLAAGSHAGLAAGSHPGLAAGLPAGPDAGPAAGPAAGLDGSPTLPRPVADSPIDTDDTPNPGIATGAPHHPATSAVEPMHPVVTAHPGGEPIAAGTAHEAADDTIAQPVSGLESADIRLGRKGAPDGLGPTREAETAAASSNAAATTPNVATMVSQGADHAAISAEGLGLQRFRSVGPVTESTEDPVGAAPSSLEPTASPPAGSPPMSATEAGDPRATRTSDLAIDRFRPMPEQAGPGADVATEARLFAGTERTSRPPATDRRPLQPDLSTLDPIAGGGDQVAAQSARPGAEVHSGTHVPSTMLQRVEDAVRRLENAPPPRSITLTIDDQGLTRVTVSMLSDGVRLTVPEGSQTPTRLVQDLEQALSNRGFELSRDGEQRERPRPDHDDAPARVASPHPRRTGADTGVRL